MDNQLSSELNSLILAPHVTPSTQCEDDDTYAGEPFLELYFDGGSRGNPGVAGAGATVSLVSQQGRLRLANITEFVGTNETNNMAEYMGLVRGLSVLRDLVEDKKLPQLLLKIFGDSNLVISQTKGEWACTHPGLLPKLEQAQALVSFLRAHGFRVELKQLPRAQNKDADALANRAMDSKLSAVELAPSATSALEALAPRAGSQAPREVEDDHSGLARQPTTAAGILVQDVQLEAMPSLAEMTQLAKDVHLDSRRLCAIAPSRIWSAHMTHTWHRATAALTPRLKNNLDAGSDLGLVQALLDVIKLPVLTLSRFVAPEEPVKPVFSPPDPLPSSELDGGTPSQKRAKNKAWMDQWALAMQELLTNGSAPRTHHTLGLLDAMHRKRTAALRRHQPVGAQALVTITSAKNYLYRKVSKRDRTCVDVFGWAADYLAPIRNTAFLRQLARLVARIGSADIPEVCAQFLTAGGLLALHKLDSEDQRLRSSQGLPPKIRPVNIGCAILKWSLQLLLATPQAKEAADNLRPIQMALGVKRGPEIVAHLFRALWEQRYSVLSVDFENGFNNFLRQAMLDAVQKRCPSLTKHFNLYYGHDSLCFFIVEACVETILGQEGSRMGDVFGSFGFDLVAQDIYEAVLDQHRQVVARALTDDLNMAIPLAPLQDTGHCCRGIQPCPCGVASDS